MKKSIWVSTLAIILAAGLYGVCSKGGSSQEKVKVSETTSATPRLAGKVEINRTLMVDGEQIIQIIDHDHRVICYGRMSEGGASTISCQKFDDSKGV